MVGWAWWCDGKLWVGGRKQKQLERGGVGRDRIYGGINSGGSDFMWFAITSW